MQDKICNEMGTNKRILDIIREQLPKKKISNNNSADGKDYGAIRVPHWLMKKLGILKLAYEIMWSSDKELSALSDIELESLEMESLSYEELLMLLYDRALRIDPDVSKYIDLATEAFELRNQFGTAGKKSTRKAVKVLVRRSQRDGAPSKDEAVQEQESEKAQNDVKEQPIDIKNERQIIERYNRFMEKWEGPATILKEEEKMAAERERKRQELRSNKKYFFLKGDELLEARLSKGNGKSSSFTADLNGHAMGYDFLINHGYVLQDEDGTTIDAETAISIKKEHDGFMAEFSMF